MPILDASISVIDHFLSLNNHEILTLKTMGEAVGGWVGGFVDLITKA